MALAPLRCGLAASELPLEVGEYVCSLALDVETESTASEIAVQLHRPVTTICAVPAERDEVLANVVTALTSFEYVVDGETDVAADHAFLVLNVKAVEELGIANPRPWLEIGLVARVAVAYQLSSLIRTTRHAS